MFLYTVHFKMFQYNKLGIAFFPAKTTEKLFCLYLQYSVIDNMQRCGLVAVNY